MFQKSSAKSRFSSCGNFQHVSHFSTRGCLQMMFGQSLSNQHKLPSCTIVKPANKEVRRLVAQKLVANNHNPIQLNLIHIFSLKVPLFSYFPHFLLLFNKMHKNKEIIIGVVFAFVVSATKAGEFPVTLLHKLCNESMKNIPLSVIIWNLISAHWFLNPAVD